MKSLQRGRTVYLRHPVRGDLEEFQFLASASLDLHKPWIYPPSAEGAFHAYVERSRSERFLGFLICLRQTDAIIGVANLSEIVRGVFQSAFLGFYGHAEYSGRGLMREGVRVVLHYAFSKAKLHRIEANVQPDNSRSLALVRALGFQQEGFSPKYLKIGGQWRDHERWAILAENCRSGYDRDRPGTDRA